MVKAKFTYDPKTKLLKFRAKGHAGADVIGKDLVCAAVSTLASTLARNIYEMAKEGKLDIKPTFKLDDGDYLIKCVPSNDFVAEALHIFYVVQVGMIELAEVHSEYVDVVPLK